MTPKKTPKKTKTRADRRRNHEKLAACYLAINEYYGKHHHAPSMMDLVRAGVAGNPSVISYYYKVMKEERMIEVDKMISRSVRTLPLYGMSDKMQDAISKQATQKYGL